MIEKCLEILLDPNRHFFAESVKSLRIVDRFKLWFLNVECVESISRISKNLEILEISGDRIFPIEQISKFLANFKNFANLKILRLTGPTGPGGTYQDPFGPQRLMWLNRRLEKYVDIKLIEELILRCPKLENLALNLGNFPDEIRVGNGKIQFAASLKKLCVCEYSYCNTFENEHHQTCTRVRRFGVHFRSFSKNDPRPLGWCPLTPLPLSSCLSTTPFTEYT